MKRIRKISSLIMACAVIGIAIRALAHDAWVEPGKGPIYRVLYGHKTPEPYGFAKVTSVICFDKNEHRLKFSRKETLEGLSIQPTGGQPVMFTVEFDNGYFVTIGKEHRNVRLSTLPASTTGTAPSHPLKFSKTILAWQPWMSRPLGQRIELIPQNLTGLPKAGSVLRLRLLLNGKPLGNQMIENNSNEQGPKTNAEGYVSVKVVEGVNRFATDHDIIQPNDIDARRLSLTAALVFVAH